MSHCSTHDATSLLVCVKAIADLDVPIDEEEVLFVTARVRSMPLASAGTLCRSGQVMTGVHMERDSRVVTPLIVCWCVHELVIVSPRV